MSTGIAPVSSSTVRENAIRITSKSHQLAETFHRNYNAAVAALDQFYANVAGLNEIPGFPSRVQLEWDVQDPREAKRAFYWSILQELQVIPMMGLRKREQTLATLSPNQRQSERLSALKTDRDPIDDYPEVSAAGIDSFVAGIAASLLDWHNENLIEIYQNLRPYRNDQYKTNERNRWKVGDKFIKAYALDTSFSNWYLNDSARSLIGAVETALNMLDGRGIPARDQQIAEQIHYSSKTKRVFESEYLQVKCFQNGNVHVRILRTDLLEKWNSIVGDPYALPDHHSSEFSASAAADAEVAAVNPFPTDRTGSRGGDNAFELFETPRELTSAFAQAFTDSAWRFNRGITEAEKFSVLEPSAGTGRISNAIRAAAAAAEYSNIEIDCVEVQPQLASDLKQQGFSVVQGDFLQMQPKPAYDFIAMNPPFSGSQECAHVWQAYQFLKPGGTMMAIVSRSLRYNTSRHYRAFRTWLDSLDAKISDTGVTFDDTAVQTCLITIEKQQQ